MDQVFCSILISNYNKEKYLKKCLDSCINQTYQNIEIIFVDNSSTDKSLDLLKNYPKIKLISIERKTNYPAINQIQSLISAFEVSKGEIIFLLDSDDFFSNQKIEKIVKLYNKDKNKKFVCDVPNIIDQNGIKKNFNYKKKFINLYSWPTIFPSSTISMRKDFFIKFRNYLNENNFTKLEIDFRLIVFAYYIEKNYYIFADNLTNYVKVKDGIMSQYYKFGPKWWKKRLEAHLFLKRLFTLNNITIRINLDFVITKLINLIIR